MPLVRGRNRPTSRRPTPTGKTSSATEYSDPLAGPKPGFPLPNQLVATSILCLTPFQLALDLALARNPHPAEEDRDIPDTEDR
jgi:hypothetical protein